MKKLLFFLCCFCLIGNKGFSQAPCVPETNMPNNALLYPEVLSPAMERVYYSQVLTFRIPSDSTIVYPGNTIHATIDSARLLYISGIPNGYYYACNTPTCTWQGGTKGCALLEGVSDTSAGEYPIKVYVYTWARAASTSFYRIDSSSYTFKILGYNGMFEITKTEPLKIYPNPSNGNFKIELRDIQTNNNILQLMDAAGRTVFEKSFDKPQQFLTIEEVTLEKYNAGLYTVFLRAGDRMMTSRVLLN